MQIVIFFTKWEIFLKKTLLFKGNIVIIKEIIIMGKSLLSVNLKGD